MNTRKSPLKIVLWWRFFYFTHSAGSVPTSTRSRSYIDIADAKLWIARVIWPDALVQICVDLLYLARRQVAGIATTMPRFVDNARTAKIHEDGLMALVSSHLAPMSIKGLLRVHRPALLVCGKQLLSTCSIVSTQTGIFWKKLLTGMAYSANIYIVVAAIRQMLITCWVSADNKAWKYFKKVLDKRNWMRYYIKADSRRKLVMRQCSLKTKQCNKEIMHTWFQARCWSNISC